MAIHGLRASAYSASEARGWEGDLNRSIQVTVFDSSDGVRSRAAVPTATPQASKSPDGKDLVHDWERCQRDRSQHLPVNKVPPPVQVEQVRADGKPYDTTRELPPLLRDLTIDYTALSFVVPGEGPFSLQAGGLGSRLAERR